jgi:hypothetical protein
MRFLLLASPAFCAAKLQPALLERSHNPAKPILEIRKAIVADPVIVVCSRVALMEHVRELLDHELGLAKRAVVVRASSVTNPSFGIAVSRTVRHRE